MLLEMNVKLRRGHFDLTTQISLSDKNVGLFGKSGAGKSTILNLIVGNLQPQSGRIVMGGKILFDSHKGIVMPREQRPVGAVLQFDSAHASETVRDHLSYAYKRTLKQRRLFKLDFLINLLELGPVLDHTIEQLTSVERQRVALVRALLKSPKLLLLDDTFAAIGNGYRAKLLPILKRLQDEFGLPVLYASQSLSQILELTDQLIVLEQGQILHSGSLCDVAKQQDFLGYLGIRQIDNILPVTIHQHAHLEGYSIANSVGLSLTLPLRPHLPIDFATPVSIRANEIALSRHYLSGISIQNQVKGRICAIIPSGSSVIVQIDCGPTLLAEITPGACHELALQEGDTVYCLFKTHAISFVSELDPLTIQQPFNADNMGYRLKEADLLSYESRFH